MSHLEILYSWNLSLTIRHVTISVLICQSNASKRLNNLAFRTMLAKLDSCWWEQNAGKLFIFCLIALEIQNENSIKLFLILLWNKHYGQVTNFILYDDAYIFKKCGLKAYLNIFVYKPTLKGKCNLIRVTFWVLNSECVYLMSMAHLHR